MHDDTVDRTTNGRGAIRELMLDEFLQLELIGLEGSENTGETPPTLNEVLDKVPPPTRFMIELKGEGVAPHAAEIVKASPRTEHVVFSGRDLHALKTAHSVLPNTQLCLNITKCREFTLEDLLLCPSHKERPLPFAMISLRASLVTEDYILACKRVGSLALTWDFVTPEEPYPLARKLITMGIEGLLIDDPTMYDSICYGKAPPFFQPDGLIYSHDSEC